MHPNEDWYPTDVDTRQLLSPWCPASTKIGQVDLPPFGGFSWFLGPYQLRKLNKDNEVNATLYEKELKEFAWSRLRRNFFFFETGSKSLGCSGWTQTCDPHTSAARVIGLQVCVTVPSMEEISEYCLTQKKNSIGRSYKDSRD